MNVDILIPSYRRPHRVKPILDNILSTEDVLVAHVDVTFVVEWDDFSSYSKEVAEHPSQSDGCVAVVTNERTKNYAGAINTALDEERPDGWVNWFFYGADDILFHNGWLKNALLEPFDPAYEVIGTNDLYNAQVLNQEHATHYFVHSTYPDRYLFEGYDHNYTDTELIGRAKAANCFLPCLESVDYDK